jgi:hypothetical protein
MIRIGEYISESLRKVENGCYRNGNLCIDDGFGDYRMSLFRLKDRNRCFNGNQSSFTPVLVREVEMMAPDLKEELQEIIKADNHSYLNKQEPETSNPEDIQPRVSEWSGEE